MRIPHDCLPKTDSKIQTVVDLLSLDKNCLRKTDHVKSPLIQKREFFLHTLILFYL